MEPTRLILVRHGESTWNATGRYQGRIDTELSELGQRQAHLLGSRLASTAIDAVYASPLQRAHDTGYAIATHHGLAVHEEPDLTEMDHGEWCGLLKSEVDHKFPALVAAWRREPATVRMPDGESLADVARRSVDATDRILQSHAGQTLVVCTHDVVLKVLVIGVLDISLDLFWTISLDNASTTIIDYTERGPVLLRLNDTCYLQGAQSSVHEQAL